MNCSPKGNRGELTVLDPRTVAYLDQTGSGVGVPLMAFQEHRPVMDRWAERKGADGIRAYWAAKNLTSLDALPGLDPSG